MMGNILLFIGIGSVIGFVFAAAGFVFGLFYERHHPAVVQARMDAVKHAEAGAAAVKAAVEKAK